MKKLNKLLALLLALAMVFCLVACDAELKDDDDKETEGTSNVEEKPEPTDEELLVGEWVYRYDLGEAMGEMLAESTGEESLAPDEAFYLNLIFAFEDDEYVMAMEIDKKSVEKYMEALVDNLIDYMIEMAGEEGMSKEDLEQEAQNTYDMSLEEYIATMADEMVEEYFGEMSYESDAMYYRVDAEAGRIYVAEDKDDLEDSDQYMVYTVEKDELTVKKLVEGDEELDELDMGEFSMEMPWKFEKK